MTVLSSQQTVEQNFTSMKDSGKGGFTKCHVIPSLCDPLTLAVTTLSAVGEVTQSGASSGPYQGPSLLVGQLNHRSNNGQTAGGHCGMDNGNARDSEWARFREQRFG